MVQGVRIPGVLESVTILQYVDDAMLFLHRTDDMEVRLR